MKLAIFQNHAEGSLSTKFTREPITFATLFRPSAEQLTEIEYFLKNDPNATLFHSPRFFASCSTSRLTKPFYTVAYSDSGDLVGVLLALRQVQYIFFPLDFLSSRMIIWGSPVVIDNDTLVYEGLYKEYDQNKPASIYTQIRNLSDQRVKLDWMKKAGYLYEDHLDIIIDLKKSEDELWREVHTKRRNEIRRATKEGTTFEIRSDENTLDKCYSILEEVYQRAKLPLPVKSHFRSLLQNSSNVEGLKLFVAVYDGKVIGCMLCLAYKDILFDYYAGAYHAYYNKYPNDIIPWEVLKWGKKNGFVKFAFGGAGKPDIPYGVRDYKLKFGGELVNYGRFTRINYPLIYKVSVWSFNLLRRILR